MTERVFHAPEEGRFYTRSGEVVLGVPCTSKDAIRKPTITDARKHGWLPSVNEVLKVLSRPYLDAWKKEQLLSFAFENPPKKDAVREEWMKSISELAANVVSLTADRGKEIHAMIERAIMTKEQPTDKAAVAALSAIYRRYGEYYLASEIVFTNSELGWGGTADIEAIHHNDTSQSIIADIKTKDMKNFKTPGVENGMQLAAYAASLKQSIIENIMVDRDTGQTEFFRWGEKWGKKQSYTFPTLLRAFHTVFEYWCFVNEYDPRTWRE